eukprot:Hpha_TRINITY_DN15872_c0_g1::TRINITY_DN15872_c0_g1_i1::g.187848::m.187848/K01363/CTSB; cathepsin B
MASSSAVVLLCALGTSRRFLSPGAVTLGREELALGTTRVEGSLPESFDARTRWPKCRSIEMIYDQGACGDCWAVSTVMAATDRWCIGKNQSENPILSVESMVGCCHVCGYGCGDGFPNYAWAWLAGQKGTPYGVVTGGGQNNTSWCSAYTVPTCNHYDTPDCPLPSCESGPPAKTPSCPSKCDAGSSYTVGFAEDNHQFSKSYAVPSTEEAIMQEIYTHGPVTAGFNVYSDWVHYPKGTGANQIYSPTGGEELGGHAVRIIGWGVAAGEKYWLVANSFGPHWGIDGGYFKIKKGAGSAGIEQNVVAGVL